MSSEGFRNWALEDKRANKMQMRMRIEKASEVDARTEHIKGEGTCRSDDEHIIALAQISGARLLYSNDRALRHDFTNKRLIDSPRGKLYSTPKNKKSENDMRRLLNRKDLCGAKQ